MGLTGSTPSVVRAGIMHILAQLSIIVSRKPNTVNAYALAGVAIILINPFAVVDIGFQLSFVVTFGLLLMTPYLIQNKNRILNWIIGTISIPIIAQLWVIPIQIFYFNNGFGINIKL